MLGGYGLVAVDAADWKVEGLLPARSREDVIATCGIVIHLEALVVDKLEGHENIPPSSVSRG